MRRIRHERGISLFMVLVFLALLLVGGLAALRSTITGQRLVRNDADRAIALQAAEAALRDAELDIMGRSFAGLPCTTSPCRADPLAANGLTFFTAECLTGLCDARERTRLGLQPVADADNLWPTTGGVGSSPSVAYGTYTGAPPISAVARQPRYLIEGFRFADAGIYYRITAIGYGVGTNVSVMLQSNFKI